MGGGNLGLGLAWIQDKNMESVCDRYSGLQLIFVCGCREFVRGGGGGGYDVVVDLVKMRGYLQASRLELFSMPVGFFQAAAAIQVNGHLRRTTVVAMLRRRAGAAVARRATATAVRDRNMVTTTMVDEVVV